MSEKRRGLGRGLGALIPTATDAQRPVDVFFPDVHGATAAARGTTATATAERPVVTDMLVDAHERAGHGLASQPGAVGTDDRPGETARGSGTSRREKILGDVGGWEGTRGGDVADAAAEPLETADLRDALVDVPGARFAELPLDAIRPNSRQPRTVFDEDALEELAGSIREIGVLQPVVVRPDRDRPDSYELILGERGWRASERAGMTTVPAIVRETDDADLLRDALLENLHRSQLNPLEEAAAYQQLLDDFGCTHDELASRISRSRPQISNTLRLLRLPPLVQRRVAAGVLSAGHARALLGLADGAAIERLAQRIVAEGLSVRATEEIVSLGGGDGERTVSASRRPRLGQRVEAVEELAARLSDRFETRVKISMGQSKGRITVEFATAQDLHRILETLSPEDAGLINP